MHGLFNIVDDANQRHVRKRQLHNFVSEEPDLTLWLPDDSSPPVRPSSQSKKHHFENSALPSIDTFLYQEMMQIKI